jgi:hypothetical protein
MVVPPLVGTPASGTVFNSPQGVTPRFGLAKAATHQGISIVAFLNVLVGAQQANVIKQECHHSCPTTLCTSAHVGFDFCPLCPCTA